MAAGFVSLIYQENAAIKLRTGSRVRRGDEKGFKEECAWKVMNAPFKTVEGSRS